jgi:hypothetical protein
MVAEWSAGFAAFTAGARTYVFTKSQFSASPRASEGLSPSIGADPKLTDDPRVTVLMPPWDVAVVRQLAAKPPTRAQLTSLEREIEI